MTVFLLTWYLSGQPIGAHFVFKSEITCNDAGQAVKEVIVKSFAKENPKITWKCEPTVANLN